MKNQYTRFFYQYWKIILGSVIFCIGTYGAWIGWQFYNQLQNKKAEAKLYQLRSRLFLKEKKLNGNILDPSSNFFSQKKIKDIHLLNDELKDYIQFLTSEKKPQSSHFISAMELAYFLTQYDKKDEALDLLNTISSKTNSKNWLYQALLIQLGSLFIDKKNYTRALYLFSIVLSNKKAEPFHFEALFKTALCYEALGQTDKAIEIYDFIKNKKNSGLYEQRAVDYKRLLKIKQKTGHLL